MNERTEPAGGAAEGNPDDTALDAALQALGEATLGDDRDELATQRARRAALGAHRRAALSTRHPALATIARSYDRVIEPTLVAAAVVIYVGWALDAVSVVLR